MKNIVYGLAIAAVSLLATNAQAAKGNVNIKGQLTGIKDTLIVFSPGQNGDFRKDTVLTPNGKFAFTLTVQDPEPIYIYTPGSLRNQEHIKFDLLAVPGENAVITGDFNKGYTISGSKFYKEYGEAEQMLKTASQPYDELISKLDARLKAGESRETLAKEYMAQAPALQKQISERILNFIQAHPNYEACAIIIPQLQDVENMKKAVGMLSSQVRNGRMSKFYQEVIDKAEEQAKAEKEAASKQAAGVEAPDFTLENLDGKALSLSSLRGKYVVLDFWGSWCIWCVRGFPEMKKYYEKYKDKFQILGIDCNDTQEKWRAAVKKYELPWLQVFNPRDSKLLSEYAIQGFPTKILVGPDGKIVKTVVGEDPSFYTFLDELFGNK